MEAARVPVAVRILDRNKAHKSSACSTVIVQELAFPSQLLALIGCECTPFILMANH